MCFHTVIFASDKNYKLNVNRDIKIKRSCCEELVDIHSIRYYT